MSDLHVRAKSAAESSGGVVAEFWGELIEIEVGGDFSGRYRGHDEGGRSGAHLFWDDEGEERFIWGSYRLDQEFEREQPAVGAQVVIYRSSNYKTRFDKEGEATGLSYGIATEPSADPLPGNPASSATDEGIPF